MLLKYGPTSHHAHLTVMLDVLLGILVIFRTAVSQATICRRIGMRALEYLRPLTPEHRLLMEQIVGDTADVREGV